MNVIIDILKFLVMLVYLFFLIDSLLSIKYNSEGEELSWLDVVYLVYAGVNFVLVIKVLHG